MTDPSTRRDTPDRHILVIGGGIIGLATALALAERGLAVTVCDRAPGPGAEASGAAAGIISPLYPWEGPPALQALATDSVARYPAWAAHLATRSGGDTGWAACGLLSFDLDAIAAARRWSGAFDRPLEQLDGAAIAQRWPQLRAPQEAALWLPDAARVIPKRLLETLTATCTATGVCWAWGQSVRHLTTAQDRVTGAVFADGAMIKSDAVVIATGAWAPELLRPLGIETGVHPIKGEILELQAPPGALSSIVVHGHRYLVPRPDGRVVVGSTAEDTGYEAATTEDAAASLRAFATALLPAAEAWPLLGHWAGLRPGSRDAVPIIGPAGGVEGLWLNIGHFRNGITLAPAAAARLCDQLVQAWG